MGNDIVMKQTLCKMINIRSTIFKLNLAEWTRRCARLIVIEFISLDYISTMVSKEVRNPIAFGFWFMPTSRTGTYKDLTLLLMLCWMRIQDMITKIGFTLVFFGAMRAKERTFMCFHMVVHGALKPLCLGTDRAYKMTSFILNVFIHRDSCCCEPGKKSQIQFYRVLSESGRI